MIPESEMTLFCIKYNYVMILFNILPIYPLDGFRIIYDLFVKKNNLFQEEIIYELSCLLNVLGIIYFYIFQLYGFITSVSFLLILNVIKIIQIKKRKKALQKIMMYDLLHFSYNNKKRQKE